jgi:hypothetical protein
VEIVKIFMLIKSYKAMVCMFLALFFAPSLVWAHQPRITESRLTEVPSPEISKAYYGKLTGEPDVYVIKAVQDFDLYVNVLVPDIAGQKKDVSAVVVKNGNIAQPLAVLDGINFEWKKFYEPFGADTYWMGPEYQARAEAGTYEIRVWSSNNDSKYSLAIGEIEAFDGKEGLNALTIIPELKKNFFDKSPIGFIRSPFGWGLIVAMYVLALMVGLLYRYLVRKFARSENGKVSKNINKRGRVIRLVLGLILLLLAMATTWNPLVIFISGLCIFESIFSWCAFYQLMGKNTCDL